MSKSSLWGALILVDHCSLKDFWNLSWMQTLKVGHYWLVLPDMYRFWPRQTAIPFYFTMKPQWPILTTFTYCLIISYIYKTLRKQFKMNILKMNIIQFWQKIRTCPKSSVISAKGWKCNTLLITRIKGTLQLLKESITPDLYIS